LAANKVMAPKQKQPLLPPIAIVIGIVLVCGLAGFLYLNHRAAQPAPAPPPLTGEAKAYLKNLGFVAEDGQTPESPRMEAHESYLKQSVVEITGRLRNNGDRVLDLVEITCVFYDPYNQVVLRERVPIVSRKMGKLAPGEAKAFRLAFDNVPEAWNQALPQMVIAHIDFS
jgi:hypothetical protein